MPKHATLAKSQVIAKQKTFQPRYMRKRPNALSEGLLYMVRNMLTAPPGHKGNPKATTLHRCVYVENLVAATTTRVCMGAF